jgi:heat-inducible transcriptional repressor
MEGSRDLGKREQEVLANIIHQFVMHGLPVGSKAVAQELPEAISPATIRNCMAELEAGGFLTHPHVSAGRVPTDKAYRYYVDRLLEARGLSHATQEYISAMLTTEAASPEHLMAKTSCVLSEVLRNLGLVLGPAPEEKLLEHIHFVKLEERRILAVIVSKPDLIENKVVRIDEEISQEELDRAAMYLNSEFRGWSLRTVRLQIFKRLEEMKNLCEQIVRNTAKLFAWGALAEEAPGPVFVDGHAKFLEQLQTENVRKVAELVAIFEEKAKLANILTACLQMASSGVRIFIGRENPSVEMQECTLIVAPYRYRHRVVGALGILGPMRLEYEHAITTVDYVAHLCSKLLSAN